MILRPNTDAELIDLARSILTDGSISLDARALIAWLIIDKRIRVCPPKSAISSLLARGYRFISEARIDRIFRDAEQAGYFLRSRGKIAGFYGRRGHYFFIVGGKSEISSYEKRTSADRLTDAVRIG